MAEQAAMKIEQERWNHIRQEMDNNKILVALVRAEDAVTGEE